MRVLSPVRRVRLPGGLVAAPMARLPRIKVERASAWYHLYARVAGPVGSFPLDHPAAHYKLLEIIRFYLLGYFCQLAAFCVMGNHYHLVARFEAFRRLSRKELEEKARYFYLKPEQTASWTEAQWRRFNQRLFDVSELMRNIQMAYAKWHNRRFHRRGAFWEGRFKSTLLTDLDAVQECLLYVDLNPLRAGLVERPEEWTRSSAYLRDLKKDEWLLALSEIFPEAQPDHVFQEYRARLIYRGAVPTQSGAKAIPDRVIREEEERGFERRGVYRKRLRYFTDGLVVGSEESIRDWISHLRRRGKYLRRRHPIVHMNGLITSLREQRPPAFSPAS